MMLNEFDKGDVRLSVREALAFDVTSIRRLVNSFFDFEATPSSEDLIIDLSCLTKLHVAAITVWLWENQHLFEDRRVFVAYTAPRQYGWQSRQHYNGAQFSELIHIPLVMRTPDSRKRVERSAVVLMGHEASRLRYALFGLNVDRGFYCVADSSEIASAGDMARGENRSFLADASTPGSKWAACQVRDLDTLQLRDALVTFIDLEPEDSRQILLPFGPKPLIVQAVATILDADEADLWISYPIMTTYSSKSSTGIGNTRIWEIDFGDDWGVP